MILVQCAAGRKCDLPTRHLPPICRSRPMTKDDCESQKPTAQERRRAYHRAYMRGWNARHRELVKERKRAWYAANREQINEQSRIKYAANPEPKRNYARVYRATFPERVREYKREWVQDNPDRIKAQSQRRRALKRAALGKFTAADWRALIARSPRCYWCGKPWTKTRRPTHDHIIPLARGGSNTIENSVCACRSCNCSKKDRPLDPVTGQGLLL